MCLIYVPAMCILSQTFWWIQSGLDRVSSLPAAVLDELYCFACVLPYLCCGLELVTSGHVYMSDASKKGYAVLVAEPGLDVAVNLGKFR